MKVLDPELRFDALSQPRGVIGRVPLVAIALGNIATNAAAVVLMVPLAIDCGFALSDNTNGKQYMTALLAL